jgi:hypothetical protein
MANHDFYAKGYEGRVIHSALSKDALEIRGCFHIAAPQPVNESGGVPKWVADLMDKHPTLEKVALSGKEGSVVWSRIKE